MSKEIKYAGKTLRFESDCEPKEPLKDYGEVPTVGWDIPSYWAIDAEGTIFGCFSGHGSTMAKTRVSVLLNVMRSEHDEAGEARVRRILQMKPAAPRWIREAVRAKWTPPAGTDLSQYDLEEPK